MEERIDFAVIGAGQAGLAMSWHLSQLGRDHLLLERAPRLGHAWRNERWDSFTLVTPNHSLRLPGFPYPGNDPHGFLPRDKIVTYVESYAVSFNSAIRFSTDVISVDREERGVRFRVKTDKGSISANSVIVATGTFHTPVLPPSAAELPAGMQQLHSSNYRNAAALPPGGVLVVGSGQSGVQIAAAPAGNPG